VYRGVVATYGVVAVVIICPGGPIEKFSDPTLLQSSPKESTRYESSGCSKSSYGRIISGLVSVGDISPGCSPE
jgi:hypothetical protein